MTDAEVREAARYFTSLTPHRWVRVVEADAVPMTRVAAWALLPGNEPIGERIVELPENVDLFEARDARTGFVAYVPPSSIGRGKEFVGRGSEGVPCSTCHGADLAAPGPNRPGDGFHADTGGAAGGGDPLRGRLSSAAARP